MAFAVLRLIVSSNFVGCSIGRSAGRAPCKIRLAYQAPRLNKSDRDVPYDIRPPAFTFSFVWYIAGNRCFSIKSMISQVGEAWDALDVPGKKALVDGGAEAIRLSAEENAKFRKIGAEVAEAKVNELESKGMPARAIYTMMKSLAEKHAKTSKNFWN